MEIQRSFPDLKPVDSVEKLRDSRKDAPLSQVVFQLAGYTLFYITPKTNAICKMCQT